MDYVLRNLAREDVQNVLSVKKVLPGSGLAGRLAPPYRKRH